MTITLEAYYNYAYNSYNMSCESTSMAGKIASTIENGFRTLITMFKKLAQKIMGLKRCKLPKLLNSQLKPMNMNFLSLFLDAKNKLNLDNKDISLIDLELRKLQNSDPYIKMMESKKEDFDEKTYEDVNMKELVGYMNKATDNITSAKNAFSKSRRDSDTSDDTNKVYQLMIHIANIHLKIMTKVFTFGKIATKTEEVPLDEPIEADTKKEKDSEKDKENLAPEWIKDYKAPKLPKAVQVAKDHGYKLGYLESKVGETRVKLIPIGMSEEEALNKKKIIFNKQGESVKELFKRLHWI